MEIGHYWIQVGNTVYNAFWDGEKFHHLHGHCKKEDCEVKNPIVYSCPAHCTCTTNPDGSIHVDCSN